MSKKARRRPSWKKDPRPFYIDLINEDTGELFETIKVTKGVSVFRNLIKRYGQTMAEEKLRQGLIALIERTLNNDRQVQIENNNSKGV